MSLTTPMGPVGSGDEAPHLRVHGAVAESRANGPGLRSVIWVQGCTLACKGCFNPASHPADGGVRRPVSALADALVARSGRIEGITVSGGEPFQQPAALAALLAAVRRRSRLSVLVFSGYRLEEIAAIPRGPEILGHIDVLIAGRYLPTRPSGRALLGSANQTLHFLTARYGTADLDAVPPAEILIDESGGVIVSGVVPPDLANVAGA